MSNSPCGAAIFTGVRYKSKVTGREENFDLSKNFTIVSPKGDWALIGVEQNEKTNIIFLSKGRDRISIQIEGQEIGLELVKETHEGREHLFDHDLDGSYATQFFEKWPR